MKTVEIMNTLILLIAAILIGTSLEQTDNYKPKIESYRRFYTGLVIVLIWVIDQLLIIFK